jgi:hypothetical protein
MDKFKLVFWVLIIAGALLKPYMKRRKERLEAAKKTAPARRAPKPAEEAEEEGEAKLPYEDLVEEVFGSYISRRKEAAEPPAPPRRAPSRAPAPEPAEAEEPAEPALPIAAAAPSPSAAAPAEELRTRRDSAPARTPVRHRSLEERLFGRRRLSSSAKLIIAAEILRPPRLLRDQGRFWNR